MTGAAEFVCRAAAAASGSGEGHPCREGTGGPTSPATGQKERRSSSASAGRGGGGGGRGWRGVTCRCRVCRAQLRQDKTTRNKKKREKGGTPEVRRLRKDRLPPPFYYLLYTPFTTTTRRSLLYINDWHSLLLLLDSTPHYRPLPMMAPYCSLHHSGTSFLLLEISFFPKEKGNTTTTTKKAEISQTANLIPSNDIGCRCRRDKRHLGCVGSSSSSRGRHCEWVSRPLPPRRDLVRLVGLLI